MEKEEAEQEEECGVGGGAGGGGGGSAELVFTMEGVEEEAAEAAAAAKAEEAEEAEGEAEGEAEQAASLLIGMGSTVSGPNPSITPQQQPSRCLMNGRACCIVRNDSQATLLIISEDVKHLRAVSPGRFQDMIKTGKVSVLDNDVPADRCALVKP